jgi:uncharacterized protein YdeI (BOF family)
MKKVLMVASVAALFATSALADKWTGHISDAKCGKAHADGTEKSMNCVKGCVKGGQAPVFVVGDKVIKIDAASVAKVQEHLGHKVEIEGSLKDDTLTIAKLKMAK